MYDESKVQRDGSIKATTFQVMNVAGPNYQKVVAGLMNSEGPIRQIFAALDNCIDEAYLARLAGHVPKVIFENCKGNTRATPWDAGENHRSPASR